MRPIRFRVKSRWTARWLITQSADPDFLHPKWDVATLGQYTGVEDADGVEIYEGDLVINYYADRPRVTLIVFVAKDYCGFMRQFKDGRLDWIHGHSVKVVGNVYENGERFK